MTAADSRLTDLTREDKQTSQQPGASRPEIAPLSMPRHAVGEPGAALRDDNRTFLYRLSSVLSRFFIGAMTIAISGYGITEMYGVLSPNTITNLQWLFLGLFSVNFVWIAFAFAQATLGWLLNLKPLLIKSPEARPTFRTAVLLPVYNEDPARITAAVTAMRAELLTVAPGNYAFFILSDTNNAHAWIREENAFLNIVNHDEHGCPVYYRRRQKNTERKAGNIADWVQTWGGAYEAMIVLDADSVMSAQCMLTLSRRLAGAPGVGLIQTLPTLVRGKSLYGRLQQFAGHCYGPIYARGLSAWHGWSSNFWGHNAIIRTRAFAHACGLPLLPGEPPLGGHVLSHDFVEAALLRRAGWGVRFDTDIAASYEEAPPSLIDVLIRDRRWCQGNLQHSAFLFARGFKFASRLHLLSGIMSYLSAVFWLLLIVVGLAIAIQASIVRPEYFANPSLFPSWPVFDAERALDLFLFSMSLVLAPKIFGLSVALLNLRRCLQFGGPLLLVLSTALEVLLSALYAPILMVSQFGVVVSILRGKDSGWLPQSRNDGAQNMKEVIRTHYRHTLVGIVIATIAWLISAKMFYWLLPITAGLVTSTALSWFSGGARRTALLATFGLLRSPQEKKREAILVCLETELNAKSPSENTRPLRQLLQNTAFLQWHRAQLSPATDPLTEFNAPAVTAQWKLEHTDQLEQLEQWLEPAELLALISDSDSLESLREKFQKQICH